MTEESDQRTIRLAKLEALRESGCDPYAIERFDRTRTASQVIARYHELEEAGVDLTTPQGLADYYGADLPEEQRDALAGRIVAIRTMGKALFAHLQDASGRIQLYVKRDAVGEAEYERFRHLDIGDIVGVWGHVFKTRTGEVTIHVDDFRILAKCLRVLPIGKEFGGETRATLADVEARYRMRYVDLLCNREARDILLGRSQIVKAIRGFLEDRGFIEVETPVLQAIAGGAAARPFVTHHNALDQDFKLRISLELPLKRLIVGGLEKVFEIGRVFRNEGISSRHNPEFTLLELYEAYTDLEGMMEIVEQMYAAACVAVNGEPHFRHRYVAEGEEREVVVDLGARPWRRLPMLEGIRQYGGIDPAELRDYESAKEVCRRVGLPTEGEHTLGGIIEKLHERYTQPNLLQPTFVTDFPIETSPLAKKRPDDPTLTRRFEVYFAQQELGNAFSEINDPMDQRARFENQLAQSALGDEEAHPMDEDYIRALEYGMPPTGGFGGGIDRLAMVLTGAPSIREVILFPLQRPS
jgi:lysyl-tRNA synthetase class 2